MTDLDAKTATASDAGTASVDKPDISLFFPVYNDEHTVRTVAMRAMSLLEEVADRYEIIIVNDGSPDRSGAIADELAGRGEKILRGVDIEVQEP